MRYVCWNAVLFLAFGDVPVVQPKYLAASSAKPSANLKLTHLLYRLLVEQPNLGGTLYLRVAPYSRPAALEDAPHNGVAILSESFEDPEYTVPPLVEKSNLDSAGGSGVDEGQKKENV